MIDKLCPRCKIRKPLSAFWNNKATPDGKYTYCKECGTTQKREFCRLQKLRIQLLREVDRAPRFLPSRQLTAIDQRIVPKLIAVFEQLPLK